MYMPELIQAGKVYRAVPPLFGITDRGGKNTKYFTTKLDFTKYVQNLFARTYTLADLRGRRLTSPETTNLFFSNIEYKDQVDLVSNTFAIDPDLLETVLYCIADHITIGDSDVVNIVAERAKVSAKKKATTKKKTSKTESASKKTTTKKPSTKNEDINSEEEYFEEGSLEDIPVTEGCISKSISYCLDPKFTDKLLCSTLKKLYRFVNVVNANGVMRIEGLVNSKYQYVFINDKFISECAKLIQMIKNNLDLYYLVDGEKVTLYGLMSRFDAMIPSGLTRYKGLGEQSPDQLGVSALRPDGDRTLIRYTIESARDEIEAIRRIDNSMASLLRDVKITKAEIE